VEHPELMRISREENISLYGVNYNDDSIKAIRWLARNKNPYQLNIVDRKGTLAIDLGVYGAPETFVVDEKGVIQYRHVGAVTRMVWNSKILPVVSLLRKQTRDQGAASE
jgi:cytochrome c biogenesis protein CcmG/thiol:disulfide interchange protein DsbE